MLKLGGALLVIMACGMSGLVVARHYTERPQYLKFFLSALQLLETQIIYAAAPLPEAFQLVGQRSDKKISPFFLRAARLMTENEGLSSTEAWNKALAEHYEKTAFNQNDLSILKSLGESLGVSDRQDQQKHIKLAAEQIKMEIVKAEAAATRNTRMWRYAGFLGGLLVVLIIY